MADDDAAPVERVVTGEGLRPPSPIDLQAQVESDGSLTVRWTRRSRLGWLWPEGTDVPLGESAEKYRVAVGAQTFEASEPQVVIPVEALNGTTGTVTISVA